MTNELSEFEKLQAENEAEVKKNATKLKLDFKTMYDIRKKLKTANLLNPPKELNQYAMFLGMSPENIALSLTPDKTEGMIEAMQSWEDIQWENGDTIIECVQMALKEEFRAEFLDDFELSRRLLFRNILPKLRNSF